LYNGVSNKETKQKTGAPFSKISYGSMQQIKKKKTRKEKERENE